MSRWFCFGLLGLLAWQPAFTFAQKEEREEEFLRAKPLVGDSLPDMTVYSPDGKEFPMSSLQGQHVVLTFGCLT